MVRYNRIFALMLAFVMAFTLTAGSALCVSAESASSASSNSLEVNVDAGGAVFNGKLYFDMVNEVLAAVGSMGDGNETVMDAALYMDMSGAVPALIVSGVPFLDQAYGIDLQNLSENLPGSVFAPDSGSQLALDQETYDMLISGFEAEVSATPDPEQMELLENGMSVLMPHWETYINTLKQNAQIAAGPKTLSLPTGDVKTTATTVTVTSEVMAEAITTLISSLAEDPEALAVLARFYDELVNSGIITPDEEMQNVTGSDLINALFQDKDELCQMLTESVTGSDMTITVSLAVDQQTEALASIGFELTVEGETAGMEAVFAGGTYSLETGSDSENGKIVFCIQKNTESLLVATLAVSENGAETARVAFNWNKEAGTYEVTVADDTSTSALTGTITSDDTSTTVTFDTIDGESMGNTYVKLSSNDPITIPSYKEVLTMTEEEILLVVQNVTSIVQQLSE